MRGLVLVFFFISGFSGLLYEVVWIRMAGTVLGSSTAAIGTVVAVFMGGLALGAWAGGRAADRRTGAALLRLYGLLELGIALSAAAVPLVHVAVLIIPTTLMGATLPVLTRYLSESSSAAPGEAGRAYAINTLGGVAGTLATGLWLIPSLGLRATTWIAVGLNLAIATASLALARGRSGAVEPALAAEPPPRRLALAIAALSGFAALVNEVAWTRALILAVGSTVYSFTLILTAFILGLAVGSGVASRFVHRARMPETVLAAIQALIVVASMSLFPLLGALPASPDARIAAVVLVPTFLMGAVFPFAVRLASASNRAVGRAVAAVYAWNTIGSIAGSLAGSFALIPLLGVPVALRIAMTVNVALALLLLPRRWIAAAVLGGLVWLLPGWDDRILASGAYLYRGPLVESAIVARYWDEYGLTTVHRTPDGMLSLRVNGKADASTGPADMETQRMLGTLGIVHHPAPQRVLVIGLGSGVTLGAAARHPVRELECVEISPAGAKAAVHFAAANGEVLRDPRVKVTIGDGRRAVRTGKEPLDVIVSQPSNLWVSGMSTLFTREFFGAASRRLVPHGIFCQWVHAYRMPLDDFRSLLRTFFDAFPEGSLWEIFPGQDYLLLGSPAPIRAAGLDEGLLGRYIASAGDVRRATAAAPMVTDDRTSIEHTAALAMHKFHQPGTIEWIDELRRAPVDPAAYPGMDGAAVERSRDLRRRIAAIVAESERRSAREVLELLAKETSGLGEDEPARDHFERVAHQARVDARSLRAMGRLDDAIRTLAAVPKASRHHADALFERALAAQVAGKAGEAERCVREILSDHRGSFAAICIQAEASKTPEDAIVQWREAIALRPDSDFAHAHLGAALARAGRPVEARQACLKSLELDPANTLARRVLDQLVTK